MKEESSKLLLFSHWAPIQPYDKVIQLIGLTDRTISDLTRRHPLSNKNISPLPECMSVAGVTLM